MYKQQTNLFFRYKKGTGSIPVSAITKSYIMYPEHKGQGKYKNLTDEIFSTGLFYQTSPYRFYLKHNPQVRIHIQRRYQYNDYKFKWQIYKKDKWENISFEDLLSFLDGRLVMMLCFHMDIFSS